MPLCEVAHYIPEKPLYEQSCILISYFIKFVDGMELELITISGGLQTWKAGKTAARVVNVMAETAWGTRSLEDAMTE